MAIEKLSVEVGICDACGKRCHGGPNGEPPDEGLSGTVKVLDNKKVWKDVLWFSCRSAPGHVGKAARAVVDNAHATFREWDEFDLAAAKLDKPT